MGDAMSPGEWSWWHLGFKDLLYFAGLKLSTSEEDFVSKLTQVPLLWVSQMDPVVPVEKVFLGQKAACFPGWPLSWRTETRELGFSGPTAAGTLDPRPYWSLLRPTVGGSVWAVGEISVCLQGWEP